MSLAGSQARGRGRMADIAARETELSRREEEAIVANQMRERERDAALRMQAEEQYRLGTAAAGARHAQAVGEMDQRIEKEKAELAAKKAAEPLNAYDQAAQERELAKLGSGATQPQDRSSFMPASPVLGDERKKAAIRATLKKKGISASDMRINADGSMEIVTDKGATILPPEKTYELITEAERDFALTTTATKPKTYRDSLAGQRLEFDKAKWEATVAQKKKEFDTRGERWEDSNAKRQADFFGRYAKTLTDSLNDKIKLYDNGAIYPEEFEKAKAQIEAELAVATTEMFTAWGMETPQPKNETKEPNILVRFVARFKDIFGGADMSEAGGGDVEQPQPSPAALGTKAAPQASSTTPTQAAPSTLGAGTTPSAINKPDPLSVYMSRFGDTTNYGQDVIGKGEAGLELLRENIAALNAEWDKTGRSRGDAPHNRVGLDATDKIINDPKLSYSTRAVAKLIQGDIKKQMKTSLTVPDYTDKETFLKDFQSGKINKFQYRQIRKQHKDWIM